MDFLNGKIRPMYLKYLAAAFGSAMITSVYSIVDTAMVGQYHGPEGTAALAVVAPVWNIIYSLGLLMGIGGSVIFSMKRGSDKNDGSDNQYFTSAVIGSIILSIVAWIGVICFERPILTFFGADESLLVLAQKYMRPVKCVFPLFLFNQMLAAFLRNDKNPGLATIGVLSGGIFNIFGDYFFVFSCDMGIYGAGLATAIGSGISFLVMMTHFVSRKNTLRLALWTTAFFGIFWTVLSMVCPNVYIHIFMAPTPEILHMAPAIIRTYALSFLLLPINIFSTYYFQAVMQPKAAFIVSVARGLVISGILIMVLPILTGADSLWFAMPITEFLVMIYATTTIRKYTKALP